ncbi:PREDICTED: ciliogenesis-associated TTC17-interacting protein-like isoform X2 [Rhagoletis zephyria]|uniref:ciliogenesis-associated TTC17-interacting protein-like isoform X2 n=1 Tax=Rhagoletis zephyria TaxID=28612 RepID=UPI0008119A7A|nr:PREDICTED: ciliogenesis-associated TTC17-interacting protein-like isoform X2 [Rhagoletis zephyria]XP_017470468.1 PREDICTED: ciliogenesis-associated TTC17-interacting protein-like isoform X2 [Rhagoletis zephyria]
MQIIHRQCRPLGRPASVQPYATGNSYDGGGTVILGSSGPLAAFDDGDLDVEEDEDNDDSADVDDVDDEGVDEAGDAGNDNAGLVLYIQR